jgi:hypothetical protein
MGSSVVMLAWVSAPRLFWGSILVHARCRPQRAARHGIAWSSRPQKLKKLAAGASDQEEGPSSSRPASKGHSSWPARSPQAADVQSKNPHSKRAPGQGRQRTLLRLGVRGLHGEPATQALAGSKAVLQRGAAALRACGLPAAPAALAGQHPAHRGCGPPGGGAGAEALHAQRAPAAQQHAQRGAGRLGARARAAAAVLAPGVARRLWLARRHQQVVRPLLQSKHLLIFNNALYSPS